MRLFTIIGALLGLVLTLVAALGSGSAPQQAALAAIALCNAVIPYVLYRVQQIGQQAVLDEKRHLEVLEALKGSQAS